VRGVLGILLIGTGLVAVYLVLSGKFPPQDAKPEETGGGSVGEYGEKEVLGPVAPITGIPGKSNTAFNIPSQRGGGGVSIWTQLGHMVPILSSDSPSSQGGMR